MCHIISGCVLLVQRNIFFIYFNWIAL